MFSTSSTMCNRIRPYEEHRSGPRVRCEVLRQTRKVVRAIPVNKSPVIAASVGYRLVRSDCQPLGRDS